MIKSSAEGFTPCKEVFMHTITVTPDDNIQQILDGLSSPATIYLKAGVYEQKIKFRAPA